MGKTKPLKIKVNLGSYLIPISVVFFGCQGTHKQAFKIENSREIEKEEPFLAERSINGVLELDNEKSSMEFYKNIEKLNAVGFIRESPVIPFCTSSISEYLLAYQYEGGTRNAFGCFEIGYFDSNIPGYTRLDYDEFKTENGLKLGISLNELERIKGKNYIKNGIKILYQLKDEQSTFLQYHDMPEYFLECELSNEKVVKIKFGFTIP